MVLKSFNDITNVIYINLAHRTDRKEQVERELAKINLNAVRFDAIKNENGALGCSLSHIECLKIAVENDYDHILVFEDDVLFLDPELLIKQVNTFFETHNSWDVLLLGGNNVERLKSIDEISVKINRCQCATAYLINGKDYIKKLLINFIDSVNAGRPIDVYWWILQISDNWYLLNPPKVVQRASYSDIEKRDVNYEAEMQDLKCHIPH